MKYLVIGGGISGQQAALYLRARKQDVTLCDRRLLPPMERQCLVDAGVQLSETRDQDLGLLAQVDFVVLSPGLPSSHVLVAEAKKRGIDTLSEIDLALQSYRGQLIGITGTNGKSTITSMIGHILSKHCDKNDFAIGGNLGEPPTQLARSRPLPPILALELSSYQLEQSNSLPVPAVAIFSSFSEDHLQRHGDMAGYFKAKWRLFQAACEKSTSILSQAAEQWRHKLNIAPPAGRSIVVDVLEIPTSWLPTRSLHDRENAWYAATACSVILGTTITQHAGDLDDFKTLSHRFEMVGRINGHDCIDDSKATNFEATLVALKSLPEAATLLLGGLDKGEDPGCLIACRDKIHEVVLFGQAAPRFYASLKGKGFSLKNYRTLDEALSELFARPNLELIRQPILLSPGCASMDEFRDFADRGNFFQQRVNQAIKMRESST